MIFVILISNFTLSVYAGRQLRQTLGNASVVVRGQDYQKYFHLIGEAEQLSRIATKLNFSEYDYLLADTDLNALHQDQRWAVILEILKTNQQKAEANLDEKLVAIPDTIYRTDQKYRMKIDSVAYELGWVSKELEAFTEIIDIKI